jgi:hypothetical protein
MRRLASALVAGLVLAGWGLAPALDTPAERVTLDGLTRIHVVVDELPAEVERAGLSRAGLQADVENRLRAAGLRVLAPDDALTAAGRPTLHLRVEVVRPAALPERWVYSVDLTLRQQVWLERDRKISAPAITWSDHRQVGAVDARGLATVRDVVRAKVEQFVTAWQTVNAFH